MFPRGKHLPEFWPLMPASNIEPASDAGIWLTEGGLNGIVDILQTAFLNAFSWQKTFIIWFKFTEVCSREFTKKKNSSLVHIMTRHLTGDKPSSEWMMTKVYEALWCHQGRNVSILVSGQFSLREKSHKVCVQCCFALLCCCCRHI